MVKVLRPLEKRSHQVMKVITKKSFTVQRPSGESYLQFIDLSVASRIDTLSTSVDDLHSSGAALSEK